MEPLGRRGDWCGLHGEIRTRPFVNRVGGGWASVAIAAGQLLGRGECVSSRTSAGSAGQLTDDAWPDRSMWRGLLRLQREDGKRQHVGQKLGRGLDTGYPEMIAGLGARRRTADAARSHTPSKSDLSVPLRCATLPGSPRNRTPISTTARNSSPFAMCIVLLDTRPAFDSKASLSITPGSTAPPRLPGDAIEEPRGIFHP